MFIKESLQKNSCIIVHLQVVVGVEVGVHNVKSMSSTIDEQSTSGRLKTRYTIRNYA